MDIEAVRRDQACLRVMQSNPDRCEDSVQVRRLGERRIVEEDPEIVGFGEPGEDHGRERGDCQGMESIARDDCVHGAQP